MADDDESSIASSDNYEYLNLTWHGWLWLQPDRPEVSAPVWFEWMDKARKQLRAELMNNSPVVNAEKKRFTLDALDIVVLVTDSALRKLPANRSYNAVRTMVSVTINFYALEDTLEALNEAGIVSI